MENIRNWPLAHALGGSELIIETWEEAWEGHLRQVGQARVPELAMARDGIYQREFTTSYDWEHIGEGLGPFYFHGLSRPDDPVYEERLRRFAGFLHERGSRGAQLRSRRQDHPQPVQRQPGPEDDAGHGRRLGRAGGSRSGSRLAAAHSVPRVRKHRRRPSPQPQRDDARPVRLHGHGGAEVPGVGARVRGRVAGADRCGGRATFRRTSVWTGRSEARGTGSGTAASSDGTPRTEASATTRSGDLPRPSAAPCC